MLLRQSRVAPRLAVIVGWL